MTDEEFPVGALVFAKVPGYSFWPAKVEAEEDLPPHAAAAKPSASNYKPVYFFGSQEFGWIAPGMLKDYEANVAELSKKSKNKQFLKGLEEIKDPSCWPSKGQFDDYSAAVAESFAAEVEQPAKRRKSTGTDGMGSEKKKRKRNTEDPSSLKKKIGESKKNAKPEVSPKDRLLRLRMKLQVFLQQKEPYQASDYEKANGYLTETEKIEMDVNLFRETKIGKVVKHLSKKAINEFDISARCRKLTEKWISELHDSLIATADSAIGESKKEIILKDENEEQKTPLSPKTSDQSANLKPQSPKKDVPKSPIRKSASPTKAPLVAS